MREIELKHTRWRENGSRKVLQAYLALPQERLKQNPHYRCPAGPGRPSVTEKGRWYDMTEYLFRRVKQGDLVCAKPPGRKPAKKEAGDR